MRRLGFFLAVPILALLVALVGVNAQERPDPTGYGCVSGINFTVNARSGPGLEFNTVGFVQPDDCYDVVDVVDRCNDDPDYCDDQHRRWIQVESLPLDQRDASFNNVAWITDFWFVYANTTPLFTPEPSATPTVTNTPFPTVTVPPTVAAVLTSTAEPRPASTPTAETAPAFVSFCRIEVTTRDTEWVVVLERCTDGQ